MDDERLELDLKIGKELVEPYRSKLIVFLRANLDVFAWAHSDMVEIDPKHACHHLN